jgi:hypothetical protein
MARLARLLFLVLLLPLGGCGQSWPMSLLRAPAAAPPPSEPPGPREVVFCYRTLADIACYQEIDWDRDGRLVGTYLRPIDDPLSKLYWLERAKLSAGRVVLAADPSADPAIGQAEGQKPAEPSAEMPSQRNRPSP